MLDGSTQVVEAGQIECTEGDWRTIDRKLKRIAKRRRGLDREEAGWLLKAERARVHTRFTGTGSKPCFAQLRDPAPPPAKTVDDDVQKYLTNMSFSPREARDATARARPHVDAHPSVEALLRAALRELSPLAQARIVSAAAADRPGGIPSPG